jgi:hypothetical protein
MTSYSEAFTSKDPHELALFDVDAPSLAPAFDDLGSGAHYGTYNIEAADYSDNHRFIFLPLNKNGLTAIQNSIGLKFALGGALTNLPGPPYLDCAMCNYVYYIFERVGFSHHSARLIVQTEESRPSCEIAAIAPGASTLYRDELPTFITGDSMPFYSLRFANAGSRAAVVDARAWIQGPNGAVQILYQAAGVRLPAGYAKSVGPLNLGTIGARLPRGIWQYGCRVVDADTGSEQAHDLKMIEIQ